MRTAVLSVAMLLFALDASAQQNIARCRNSSGTQGDCTSIGVAPAAALPIRGTTITATTQFTGSGAGLTSVPAASVVGSLSGVTISCASNTCQNIALTSAVTGILPLANGGTNSATGDLVATNFLTAPLYKLVTSAAPGTPSAGQAYLSTVANNGLDQLQLVTADGITTAIGVGTVTVRNTSGSTITAGQAVYVSGSTGNVPNVALARSNVVSTTAAYGLMLTASCTNNAYCRLMRQGIITGIDTSAFSSGDVLWVSSSTAGGLQNTDPQWPNYSTHLGTVLVSGVGNGSIAVTASPTYGGNETGTTSASWTVGPGSGASAASVKFANANTGTLSWTPTGTRTLTLPDTTSSLVASNDTRLPPAPTAANKLIYDTGAAYAETAACGTAGYILEGGSPPACTQSPTVGTKITVPRIDSSGALILNGATGNNVQLSVNSTTVFTAAAAGLTAAQPLAMSSQKIMGLATATASGDALAYPWITSTYGSSVLGATYTLSDTNGTYSDTGLSVSLPSAGTYKVVADVRAEVLVTVGAGAYIECKLYNSTDATDVSNSERFITQANALAVLSQDTAPISKIITVAAAKTIKLYCSRNAGTTYTTSDIPSDANGRTEMSYVKISDT